MEKIDLGKHKLSTSWDDITLKQWCDYVRMVDEKQEDGKVSAIDTVVAFSDFTRAEIMQMPAEVFDLVIKKMKFVFEEPKFESTDKVVVNGETYYINYMEKLKVQEYLDANTVIDSDKFNYPMLFAILCRKDGELYDDDFIANKLADRVKMFEELNVKEGLSLFFSLGVLYIQSQNLSQNSLLIKEAQKTATELVKYIESSLKVTDYIIPSRVRQIIKLRKLKKSLNSISQHSLNT